MEADFSGPCTEPWTWYTHACGPQERLGWRASVLDPGGSFAWNGMGNALANLQRYEEALVVYERASNLDPAYAYAWSNKATALRSLGRAADAEAADAKAEALGS